MILTNKMDITINMNAIMEDFDIYCISRNTDKLDHTNILDIPTNEFKAFAVQYSWGRKALVLFQKDSVKESRLRERLNSEFEDVIVYKMTIDDLNDTKFCSDNFYHQNRLLVQLLFNSLMNYKSDLLSYNNLTGKLFYSNPDWIVKDKLNGGIAYISYVEVKLDPGMYLNLDIKTFRRDRFGKYLIDKKTGLLRKKLKTDDATELAYREGSFKNKHKTIDYLDITSFEKFQKTKLGIMYKFMADVDRKLGKYLSISLSETLSGNTYEISKKEKQGLKNEDIGAILNKRGVVIVDENHTDKSHEIVERLKFELLKYYKVDAELGELSFDKYNIRIIHTPEYYERLEIQDPHSIGQSSYIVQHLMEEVEHFNEKDSASPAVNKIVQELIIKGDVRDGQISIYDWKGLDSDKEWTFVTRNKIKLSYEEKNETHLNTVGKPTYDYYTYKLLKIGTNGNLQFEKFSDQSELESDVYEAICYAYDKFTDKYRGGANAVEGLVFSDIENIHAILLTAEKTIPNIEALALGLKETDKAISVSVSDLIDGIESFIEYANLTKDEMAVMHSFKNSIEEMGDNITLLEVKKLLGMGKKLSKLYNRYMHENYNIWISAEIKDQDFNDLYLLDNILDIKYYEQIDYEGTPCFCYYVGTKRASLQGSIHNACAIRKVVSEKGDIEFKELLPLMAVDFVRNKQYTVLPFPFKYLREWRA